MTERLIAKLDRLGAEAGIKEMTPEIYQFAQLLNDEKMKQWDEWKAKREWVGLTDVDRFRLWLKTDSEDDDRYAFAKAIEQALKEQNA